ncbi:unnamed protein product [Chrysoparadoxa australica]
MACIGCPDGGFLLDPVTPMPAVAPPSLPEDVCSCPGNTFGDGSACFPCPRKHYSLPGTELRSGCQQDEENSALEIVNAVLGSVAFVGVIVISYFLVTIWTIITGVWSRVVRRRAAPTPAVQMRAAALAGTGSRAEIDEQLTVPLI